MGALQVWVYRFQGDLLADVWTEICYLIEQEARFCNSSQFIFVVHNSCLNHHKMILQILIIFNILKNT
ncbi:hypothetical protein HanRHA438_Chr13g0616871 [Helianthus annuus]|nr:hypothetical protein HanRHA438_Chr13g0616871 [Helianthus annuus]